MTSLSTKDLQDIAVRCTSDFINSGVSLNQSLSKEAQDRSLNPEQLRRSVEATNTLTYLKTIAMADSRTAEFPVANYNEIVKMACLPDMESLHKTAQVMGTEVKPRYDSMSAALVKQANEALEFTSISPMGDSERKLHILKLASSNARSLEVLKDTLGITVRQLQKEASDLSKNPKGLEYLSSLDISDERFIKLAGLMFGPDATRKTFAKYLTKAAEMNTAQRVVDLYEQSLDCTKEIVYLTSMQENLNQLEKNAFVLPMLSRAGGAIGKAVSGATNKVAAGTGRMIGKGIRSTAVKTVSTVADMTGKVAKGIGNVTGSYINNVAAKSPTLNKLGIKPKKIAPNIARNTAIAAVTGTAILDAASHIPEVDPTKDTQGRVWNALRGS